jgi:hypothetical protein
MFSYNQKLSSFTTLQNFILDKESRDEPFFIGRMSGNENVLAGLYLNENLERISEDFLINNMLYGAGIKFNSNNDIVNYCKLYNNSILNSNLLGVWDGGMYNQAETQYIHLNKDGELDKKSICAHSLEPFYYMNEDEYRFNDIFKNKKILIISSHKETIISQLEKSHLIFKKNIFDDSAKFYVYKPPQQNAGSNDSNSWEHHFDQMKLDLKNIKENEFNFDIALVSCGGFGMITSNFIYSELKSSAIYIGGALQLFFGIKGNRWISDPVISTFMNEHWTNVMDADKPQNVFLCENSSYW